MFCPSCGLEIRNDAQVCDRCGAAQKPRGSSESPSKSPPTSRAHTLRRLHTFDWEGKCPSCGFGYTSETASCPNDGSPLVVAFDTSGWNPASLYIYSAELRCLGNCGFNLKAINCDDGTVITGPRISFSFSPARMLLHQAVHVLAVLLGLALVAPGLLVVFRWVALGEEIDLDILTDYPYPFYTFWPGGWLLLWSSWRWWPFRSRFTFEDVEKQSA